LAWKYSAARARYIFWQSFPAMMAAIAVMLLFRVNHVLLVYLAGFETVGQYAVAFTTSQLFLVLPQVFFGAIYPRLVHLHSHDPARYRTVLNICYYGFTLLGYLILLFCIVFAPWLFHVVFGTKFDEASQIIVLLAVANVFNFSGSVRARAIDIANSSHYHLWNALLGLIILVPASWIAIPVYGAFGAAFCICVAMLVSGVLTSFCLPAVREDAPAQFKALLLIPSFKLSEL
jgi:O-antigen/teichoic acid export membrane protein